MNELVYAGSDVEKIIKDKYPQAKIADASDDIHTERFELELDGVSENEFYPFAISEGFARCCFGFELHFESLRFPETKSSRSHKETKEMIEKWCESAKIMNKLNGGNGNDNRDK